MTTTTYYCDVCGEPHKFRCPKLNEKRREQVRAAQARYRERQRAEKEADAKIRELREKVRKLQKTIAEIKRELDAARRASSVDNRKWLGVRNGERPARARRRVLQFLHPDKHDGHPEATRLTQLFLSLS